MGRLITVVFLWMSLRVFAAGDTTLPLQKTGSIPGNFSSFYTDNLQNIYLVNAQQNTVKKQNSNGDSVAVLNNIKRYGKLSLLDVSNPLKILAYYPNFATVVLLDRFLAIRATVDLRRLGITQAKAVALSYDGNIWLYDEGDGKIKKLDESGNILLESADLRLVLDDAPSPDKIIDNNGMLYLYDKQLGWLLFDYYTALKKRLPFSGWSDAEAQDNQLSGRSDSLFFFTTPNDIDFRAFGSSVPLNEALKTSWLNNKLYLLTRQGLTMYSRQP